MTVRAVADKPDWIGSERIDPFARVRELAAPSKHPPRTDQLRPIAHVFPADLGAAYVWLQSQALGVYAMEENRSPFRSWVNSGKVQTEQMFSGLCLKADARRFEGAGVSNTCAILGRVVMVTQPGQKGYPS